MIQTFRNLPDKYFGLPLKYRTIVGILLIGVPILVVMALYYFFAWPYNAFQGNAKWIGEAFWILVLVIAALAAANSLVIAGREQRRNMLTATDSGNRQTDELAFEEKVRGCLGDRSIVGYFKRNLVEGDDVTEALVTGDALEQALAMDSYRSFAHRRSVLEDIIRWNDAISYNAFNERVATVFIGVIILISLLFAEISMSDDVTTGIAFISLILAAISGWIYTVSRTHAKYKGSRLASSLSFLPICGSLCALIVLPLVINIKWRPFIIVIVIWLTALVIFHALPTEKTARECRDLLAVGLRQGRILYLRNDVRQSEREWLNDCENMIKEQANLAINTILGEDKDRLLVEQDSEGLRKLQDPSYTVSTRSEQRIASILSQMDNYSIAVAGPRGAGKSTLLRKFSGPLRSSMDDQPCISIYLAAPAEYVPRDFIAGLFQQLCEAYLVHEQCPLIEPIYKEPSTFNWRRALNRLLKLLWLIVRSAICIAIMVWVIRSFVSTHYHSMYITFLTNLQHWYDRQYHYVIQHLYKPLRPYWTLIRIAILIFALIFLLTPRRRGKVKPRREPVLAKRAREYLRRLQVDKTVNWGTSVGSSAVRGINVSFNRGGSASYIPWTLPDLVAHTRRFMKDIAEQFQYSNHAIIVGIDEIDRIGSLDHAEKFIGEIKAIFGVEKCIFLVAVAEDVGSIFAQRATVGRTILENAFDDIVMVDPLNFQETRDLLLKRVPGFTDSFVYLVHALSGGLPRELIRFTRRLVEVNQEVGINSRQPRLQDLAFFLVKEELIEAMRATRNQLARLTLHDNWTPLFEKLQSASRSLRYASPFSVNDSCDVIKELSELTVPAAPEGAPAKRSLVTTDEDEARRIVRDFTAFSYFGIVTIEAFSDGYFTLSEVQQATANGLEGSYEELAVARTELTVSPENSREMLQRFRAKLTSRH